MLTRDLFAIANLLVISYVTITAYFSVFFLFNRPISPQRLLPGGPGSRRYTEEEIIFEIAYARFLARMSFLSPNQQH